MLFKERSKPKRLTALGALLNRLPNNHARFEEVSEEYRKRAAGFGGEQFFDKHIHEFRPSYPYALLHDICLRVNGIYFQIDSLLITPSAITVFEVKNLAGKIMVKSSPTQFIQVSQVESKVIQSPITELDRKEIFLQQWLKKKEIDLPIRGIVVFSFANEILIDGVPARQIICAQEVPILLYQTPLGQEILSFKQIRRLAEEMVLEHQEYIPKPLTDLIGISVNHILQGVACPKCRQLGMIWLQGCWQCGHCGAVSRHAHHKLLDDWFLLINNKITNRQFREFSFIENVHVAKRLLRTSGLKKFGTTKDVYYQVFKE
ncbi:nuclease-related domain-containing protein [Sporosarcina sp. Te-1]|uniref:nuclease-related domain-containing protein n=1 Tax=Sporosarcina sp. Te-1 TaxID=2818390 RepID=UPI001A9D2875|nr:nuclease-related domain-containing protein [Sporosarcina sp. Te-1]QTD39678.1 NERD domain-containing protein [Sporosarcina sp. Te-1]